MEIEDSLVLNLIAIKLEPQMVTHRRLSSTAKASVTSQLGGGRKKREKNRKTKGAPDNPRASRQKASPREAGRRGGAKEEPSRW